ncbi:MAG: type II secretion system protein N [Burkholderiales bacterium]
MSEIFIGRSGSAQTVIVSLATLSTVALLGWVLAYWTWQWLAPRPVARAPAVVEATDTRVAQGLFGAAQTGPVAARSTAGAFTLLGVAAASAERDGHAVFRLENGKTAAVREGGDLYPGVRLLEVHADHVVLERNGARETLAWPKKTGAR